MNKTLKKALIIILWLLVWQAASVMVGNHILLAGPWETLQELARDIVTLSFWKSIAFSGLRILAGFVLAYLLALCLGTLAWRVPVVGELLEPLVSFIKSVPVVCIIVLLLVWVGSAQVSVIAVALMVFPPVYFSYLEGLGQTKDDMRQMLDVFGIRGFKRIRYYYWPAVMPYLVSASKVVVGISWKSGIAAEIIGIPNGSIGSGIYMAKIGLDTAGLFSWTFVIVALSQLCEKLFLWLLGRAQASSGKMGKNASSVSLAPAGAGAALGTGAGAAEGTGAAPGEVRFQDVSFAFGDKQVLKDFSQVFEAGGRYCLMAASGAGKSTLQDLVCGFLEPDEGSIQAPSLSDVSRDFQENRLLEQLSAWDNVRLACPHLSKADQKLCRFELDEFLGEDSRNLAIPACSGGMKRKVALMRSLVAPGSLLLLDEPFAGMDNLSRVDAVALINHRLQGRTLILTSHDPKDAETLGAQVVRLP